MTIDHLGPEPKYIQLANLLRERIERGELAPDRPIPSKRTLRQEHGVAGETVDRAVGLLREAGLVKTVRGKGIYVTRPEERPAAEG